MPHLSPLALALVLIAGCDSSAPAAESDPTPAGPTGTWETTYGTMTFGALGADGVLVATYTQDEGRIEGSFADGVLVGYWTETASNIACPTPRDGRDHWGRVEFVFDDALAAFDGTWGYCDEAPTRGWTGTKR